jgi:clan AA aspartic protease (TIGR02281 family)
MNIPNTTILDINVIGGVPNVTVKIWNYITDDYSSLTLVLDTGACTTTISNELLSRAGYDCSGDSYSNIITASGIEQVDVLRIPKIKLGQFSLNNTEVYVHDFPEESLISGVLGMNVLEQFDVELKFKDDIVIFS